MADKIPTKIRVRQVKGTGRKTKEVRDTIAALGLGRIGKERVHNVNAALVGMLRRVEHLIEVEAAE